MIVKEEDNKNDISCSEESESDYESSSHSSIQEMNKNDIKKLYNKKQKRPGLETVKSVIRGNILKRNNIFEEPSKSIPLPRKMGIINITFSERKFPTPARESSHVEEQEVLFLFIIDY